ncbi:unnamed protein product [Schistosoma mattheei]|uniref:Uncharacterized protein n=1 Tax=Schistosoma mattheei TaxID=31246 RepID=A0A183NW36_9TREM|nr:unnamed protein product [Schistosoma mattheei]
MVVESSRQETLDPGFVLLGTRQQGVPVILRILVLPGRFDLLSPSFTALSNSWLVSKDFHCRGNIITNSTKNFKEAYKSEHNFDKRLSRD